MEHGVITNPDLLGQLRRVTMERGYDGVASPKAEEGFVIFDPEAAGVSLVSTETVLGG